MSITSDLTNIRPLNDELQSVVLQEMQETPELIANSLSEIRAWLKENPYIRPRDDNQLFLTFLRGCRYDMKLVKEKIESYYAVHTQMPEFFADRNTKNQRLRELLDMGIVIPLPNTINPHSPKIILIRFTSYDPSKYKLAEVMSLISIITDIIFIEDDNSSISGQVMILDLSNASFRHVLQFTPKMLKKFSVLGQGGNPITIREQHFVNVFTGFETVFNIFKGFIAKEGLLMEVHGNLESLHKFIPKHLLPAEHGGTEYKISDVIEKWHKKFDDYYEYFIEERKYGVDLELKKKMNKAK